jgi:hypothetical protein
MQIKRATTLEWNLNTVVQAVGLVIIFSGGLFAYFTTVNTAEKAYSLALENQQIIIALQANLNELTHEGRLSRAWREGLERAISEQQGRAEANIAVVASTASALDDRLDDSETSIARLSDRVSAAEARSAELGASLQALQSTINEISGDVKVMLLEQRRADGIRGTPNGRITRERE